jgi:hypothetical protein
MASRSTLRNTDPKKVSGELFALTYGGLVSTLLRDYENVDDVNKQVKLGTKCPRLVALGNRSRS